MFEIHTLRLGELLIRKAAACCATPSMSGM